MSQLEEVVEEIARRVYHEEESKRKTAHPPPMDERARALVSQYEVLCHKTYLTRREVAVYLSVSEKSIAEWARRPPDQNPFPEAYAGGEPRTRRQKIDEWVEREADRRRLRAVV